MNKILIPGRESLELFGQDPPADARHHHIGQQQMNRPLVAFAHPAGPLPVFGFQDPIAEMLQNAAGQAPDQFIVFRQENRFLSPEGEPCPFPVSDRTPPRPPAAAGRF